jgi:hypothetical protein
MAGYHWEHLRTVLRLETLTFDHGRCVQQDNRYYVCSMAVDSLSSEQWLQLVRRYPGVENVRRWRHGGCDWPPMCLAPRPTLGNSPSRASVSGSTLIASRTQEFEVRERGLLDGT